MSNETIDRINEEIMSNDVRQRLQIISGYIGSPLTEEQMAFASNFTKDTISFSDPGTGKTHTLTAGLIMAQAHYKIPGSQINCMSFTNAAVAEMAGRYAKLCKKMSVESTVVFNTFHSLSRKIMNDAYPRMRILGKSNVKADVEDMQHYLEQIGIDSEDVRYVRKVLRAINDLNSSLTFHPENVAAKYSFVELGMDIDDFQDLRKTWFLRGITLNEIVQGDIPLYCLYALMNNEDIINKWKRRYKIMVVDEFQDLSLLHLNILSYIAETLVVIGDMKQQIYAFNGACPEIVREYLKLHPNAAVRNLTISFRCGQNIADAATKIIKPNDESVVPFTGHNRGSSVSIIPRKSIDWKVIVDELDADRRVHGVAQAKDIMFLYRNNASAIPIIEELYKKNIPFRCSKYSTIMEIPMFESLSKLCNAAWQPMNMEFVNDATHLFPEFKSIPFNGVTPIVQAMKSSGKNLFEVNYNFKESSSVDLMNAMMVAAKAIAAGKSAGIVYMKVMEAYKKHIYKNEWWKMDNTEEWYFGLVSPICNSKPYPLMYNEELDKLQKNQQAIQAGVGVRCYTMHSAKGLEADKVYILDADEGTFPNAKIMKNKVDAGCYMDVATDIRSERNLLYVAITRAKDEVVITYTGAEPAKLIVEPDNKNYCQYDEVYFNASHDYDDANEFFKLFRLGDYKI